ncbi:MAG TPA: hypothetical protein VFF30_05540 [Nitrososphaerales archaeon]|nr:hypothetical protein [Nitrososphaerales archaeon]
MSEQRRPRRFADFYEDALPFQMSSLPEGGMCLSDFLILWKDDPHKILMGKVNQDYDWITIGALDKASTSRISNRWILPSSHLLLYESPFDGAKRILREQLGVDSLDLDGPRVYSEVYDAPKLDIKNHWDIEFVFVGDAKNSVSPHLLPDSSSPTSRRPWSKLEFVDVTGLKDSEFARNHQDILAEAGFR